jgi:hypothetical protein
MEYTIPTPILYAVLPFLFIGFVINGFVIWLFTKKDIPLDHSYWMSLLSYIVVATLGLFISVHNSTSSNLWALLLYYVVSMFFEWLFLYAYFQKYTYSWFRCAYISAISNTITFGIAVYSFFWGTGLLTKYADFVKIQLQHVKL